MPSSATDGLNSPTDVEVNRRNILVSSASLIALTATNVAAQAPAPAPTPAAATPTASGKPNILIIWGDDIGIANVSAYSNGLMGYETPNIDRIAKEGLKFQHYYGEQSCTAGRSAFLTGQHIMRSGLSKVGFPGAPMDELTRSLDRRSAQEPRLRHRAVRQEPRRGSQPIVTDGKRL